MSILKKKTKKNILNYSFLFFLATILIIFFLEICLRILGFEPWQNIKYDLNEPITNQYDSKIGWRPKQGNYIFPPFSEDGKFTNFTILEDGSRLTGKVKKKSLEKVLFIGGSFTQGWAVDDQETFPWFLQEKLKDYNVKNYGVGGYGTYQSFLLLEEILKKNNDIKMIVYSYINAHRSRNIGDASWLSNLNKFSKRGHLSLPYADLDMKGNLIKNSPVEYIKLPFREYSSLVTRLEKKIMRIKFYSKYNNKTEVLKKIIIEMKNLSRKNGSKFFFINLDSDRKYFSSYKIFLKKNKIKFADCGFSNISDDYRVKNDGHPNGKLHKIYAECIYDLVLK